MKKISYSITAFMAFIALCAFLFVFLINTDVPILADSNSCMQYLNDKDSDRIPSIIDQNDQVDEALKYGIQKYGKKCGNYGDPINIMGIPGILLILDQSGSMGARLSGDKTKTRMQAAKETVEKFVKSLPKAMKLGFIIYGKDASCSPDSSMEVVGELGKIDKNGIINKLKNIRPRGTTPMAMAIRESVKYVGDTKTGKIAVALISDGLESCESEKELLKAMADLKKSIDPSVFVFGLDVDKRTEKQLSKLAKAGGGKYSSVKNMETFEQTFMGLMKHFGKLFSREVCIMNQHNLIRKQRKNLHNKALIKISSLAIKGDESVKKCLPDIKAWTTKQYNEYQKKTPEQLKKMFAANRKQMEQALKTFKNTCKKK